MTLKPLWSWHWTSRRPILGKIDSVTNGVVEGWVDYRGPVKRIDFHVDNAWVAAISPVAYRPDLEEAGIGDGRRSFAIDLSGFLTNGSGQLHILLDDEPILESPHYLLVPNALPPEKALELSQTRWRGDESRSTLTWGREMDGDQLVALYTELHEFSERTQVLEIGPGYGRILKALLDRKTTFQSYFGLDLSGSRVAALAGQFSDPRVHFAEGDVMDFDVDRKFDLVVSSATFEHLYPDARRALCNLHARCLPNTTLAIDFIKHPEPKSYFEDNGTYIRVYTPEQLRTIFAESGFEVLELRAIDFGASRGGISIERWMVAARPLIVE